MAFNAIDDLRYQRDMLLDALEGLVAVVGLTAFKHESQRSVLQDAVDAATGAIKIANDSIDMEDE